MAWGAIAGAVIGGMMSSDAAGDAASAQAGAANASAAAQERMFNKQVELQSPFRQSGLAANNKLLYLLGLSSSPYGLSGSPESRDALRNELVASFTKKGTPGQMPEFHDGGSTYTPGDISRIMQGTPDVIDESGLSVEIDRRMAEQAQKQAQMQGAAASDPLYGSLMRDFSMADFESDPGYAFRQREGLKGVESGAAARGGLLSGAALKAIQKYGQDLASQEYGNAYGRFTSNQTNKYNKLAGLVNTGQGATNVLTNAAGNLGNAQAQSLTNAGNAQAAGIVGQANAWNQAIGQGYNAYQQNQLMDMIRNPSRSSYVSGYGYGTSYGE